MSKHTPGPWRASFDTDYTWFIEADIGCVGELNMWQPDAADADALLISLAPEMAEALRDMVAWQLGDDSEDPEEFSNAMKRARAILAKLEEG